MPVLTAPYNFVPLNKKVVRPYWAKCISHDKPFKDGLSGTLQLVITAESPIYVRNSSSNRKEPSSDFSKAPDGTFFIPGSSIKGAIRNVLEIMSFGDFRKNHSEEKLTLRNNWHEKYSSKFSIKELAHKNQNENAGCDLAECIFGYANDDEALKGRVYFGHTFCQTKDVGVLELKKEVLGSPKPTFFPTYIEQKIDIFGKVPYDRQNKPIYKTYDNEDAVLSGWKRYPVHSDFKHESRESSSEEVSVGFQPLPNNISFEGSITYHNLRPIELGAILSAITFHNIPHCFHSLGMAKPFGYGKVRIDIPNLLKSEQEKLMCKFEAFMEFKLKGQWLHSDQIKSLLTMASNQKNKGRSELKYMYDVKDFGKVKKDGQALDRYMNLEGIEQKLAKSLLSKEANALLCSAMAKEEDMFNQKRISSELQEELRSQKQKLKEVILQNWHSAKNEAYNKESRIQQEAAQRAFLEAEQVRIRNIIAANQKEALQKGLDLSDVDPKKKANAWEEIKKRKVPDYLRTLPNKPTVLPQRDYITVENKVLEIAAQLPKKEFEKWCLPKMENHFYKQLSFFLGEHEGEKILDKVKNVSRS